VLDAHKLAAQSSPSVSLAAALVAFIIVRAYKTSLIHDASPSTIHMDQMWRILIGLGCIPGVVALYFRLTIPETPRFTMDIERNVQQASQDVDNFLTSGTYYVDPDAAIERVQAPKASRRDFIAYFSKWENMKVLIGTSYSWFALDVCHILLSSVHVIHYIPLDRLLRPGLELFYYPQRHWLRQSRQIVDRRSQDLHQPEEHLYW
jgi:hypothetical protein